MVLFVLKIFRLFGAFMTNFYISNALILCNCTRHIFLARMYHVHTPYRPACAGQMVYAPTVTTVVHSIVHSISLQLLNTIIYQEPGKLASHHHRLLAVCIATFFVVELFINFPYSLYTLLLTLYSRGC